MRNLKNRYNRYRYQNYTSSDLRPNFDRTQLIKEGYFSQCGQDKWLVEELFTLSSATNSM